MKYLSTRDKKLRLSSSEAIIQGISKDGGLFVPETFPKVDNLIELVDLDYRQLAFTIMSKYFTDFEPSILKNCIDKAYNKNFSAEEIVPVKKIGDIYFLELFHGPTLAFKDMALSILPYFLKASMKINNMEDEVVILTATSGDTGKAALEGFADLEDIKIIVFYPQDGVSNIQKLQMITQEGDNTFVVGIRGNFDDAQRGVKEIFNDKEFVKLLKKNNFILSSANSINIGRLIPQIVYYFYGYLNLLKKGELKEGDKLNIVVPTGNFGNILAAYYAKQMGLPINKLICASNENNILYDFINTGIYDARRELKLTSSPSMDILVSSNLERLLFHKVGEDDRFVKDLMMKLSKDGLYRVDNLKLDDFYGDFATEAEVTKAIKNVFELNHYLIDPHTAVAYSVYEKYKIKTKDNTKALIASTASPFKFSKKVADAIGLDTEEKDEFQVLRELSLKANVNIPKAIDSLIHKPIIHDNYCDKKYMKEMVENFLITGDKND